MNEIVKVQILELIVISITISGLFLWSRSESREDTRRLEELVSSIHRETCQEMSSMHQETYQEMKDFHGRLAGIESNKLKKEE